MDPILVKLFEHNHWANLRAVDACANLTEAQLDASVHGTLDSIRNTLMHIAGCEQRLVLQLSGRQPTYDEGEGWSGIGDVRRSFDESGRALIELAGRAGTDDALKDDGHSSDLPAAVVYVQVINHATEHRSQISTILTQQGIEPPDFSAWAWAR